MSRPEKGTYICHGVEGSAVADVTKNGVDRVTVKLRLDNGDGESPDVEVSAYLYFTEKSASFSFDRMKALGWNGVMDGKWEGIGSKEAECIVDYETYNGAEQMRVEIKTGKSRVEQLPPADQAAFVARLNKLAALAGLPTAPTAPANGKGREGFRLP